MVKLDLACLSPTVNKKIQREVHRIVNTQIREIEKIEATNKNLNPIDYEMLYIAKKYGKLVRELVDNLSECK